MILASVALADTVLKEGIDFWTVAIILALLFGFFGFVQGPGKTVLNSAGLFLAYGASVKTAEFIRQSVNFAVGTRWDQSTLPVIKFTVFLFAFLIIFLFIRVVVSIVDRFSAKLIGWAIGLINGLVFSTFMLEFMAKYWKQRPPQIDLNMDLSWFLHINPSWKGALALSLHFNNNPEVVYHSLDKLLKFLVFAILILAIPPVFQGIRSIMKVIVQPALNFLGLSE
jgi:hypothetical protein